MRFGIEDRRLLSSWRRQVRHGFAVLGDLDLFAVGESFLDLGKVVPQIPDRECFHEL
jgi:hypothetical protein